MPFSLFLTTLHHLLVVALKRKNLATFQILILHNVLKIHQIKGLPACLLQSNWVSPCLVPTTVCCSNPTSHHPPCSTPKSPSACRRGADHPHQACQGQDGGRRPPQLEDVGCGGALCAGKARKLFLRSLRVLYVPGKGPDSVPMCRHLQLLKRDVSGHPEGKL